MVVNASNASTQEAETDNGSLFEASLVCAIGSRPSTKET